jgi:hypothetical protein
MMCIVMLIFALVLVLGISDDGYLGKSILGAPNFSVSSLLAFSPQDDLEKPDYHFEPPPIDYPSAAHHSFVQALYPLGRLSCKIISCSPSGGAGGLPG